MKLKLTCAAAPVTPTFSSTEQRHAAPARNTHCAVAHLATGHAGLHEAAAVAGAMMDRHDFSCLKMDFQIIQR